MQKVCRKGDARTGYPQKVAGPQLSDGAIVSQLCICSNLTEDHTFCDRLLRERGGELRHGSDLLADSERLAHHILHRQHSTDESCNGSYMLTLLNSLNTKKRQCVLHGKLKSFELVRIFLWSILRHASIRTSLIMKKCTVQSVLYTVYSIPLQGRNIIPYYNLISCRKIFELNF